MSTYLFELSETWLDLQIPSFPCSPRCLSIGSNESTASIAPKEYRLPKIKAAVDFLLEENEYLGAAESGEVEPLQKFLSVEGADIQQINQLGRNALHLAIFSENEKAIRLLVEAGVDPNVKDELDETPLSLCLWRNPNLRVVKMLFEHGAVLPPRSNAMDTGHFLQFIMLCTPTEEEKQILQLLVQHGSLINDPKAPGGRQALHLAALANNCALIEVLVHLGANLFLTNSRNMTPKEFAKVYKCREAYTLLEQLESLNSDNMSQIEGMLFEGEADLATLQGLPKALGDHLKGARSGDRSGDPYTITLHSDPLVHGIPPKGIRVEGFSLKGRPDSDEELPVEEASVEEIPEEVPQVAVVEEVAVQEVSVQCERPECDHCEHCCLYCNAQAEAIRKAQRENEDYYI